MTKYRVDGILADKDGLHDIPDSARIIGALYHPQDGTLNVVILTKVPDKIDEPEKKIVEEEKKTDGI